MDNRFPKIRLLEYKPLLYNGQPFVYLRDPLQLSDKTILIPQPLTPVLAYCDGSRDIGAISAMIAIRYGIQISVNVIDGLVEVLDKAFLLENQRFGEKQQEALEVYRQAPFRPSCCAGHSYPDDPTSLMELFANATPSDAPIDAHPRARAVISPHIDYARGAEIYGRVWQSASQAVQSVDVIVIFGTDHAGNDLITLTRQNYATPLGTLLTDVQTVEALSEALGEQVVFKGELRHASEHSIELVVAWCQYAWLQGNSERKDGFPKIIPILTGDISDAERAGQGLETLEQLVQTLGNSLSGKRVIYVAAADLAHVGPAFDGAPIDDAGRQVLESADREVLSLICDGDAQGFLSAVQRVQNRNNICGVTPIYLALRMVQPCRGITMGYSLCPADENRTSLVSVCGIILE
jgi:AmmeMemoRadiSam system protein B